MKVNSEKKLSNIFCLTSRLPCGYMYKGLAQVFLLWSSEVKSEFMKGYFMGNIDFS